MDRGGSEWEYAFHAGTKDPASPFYDLLHIHMNDEVDRAARYDYDRGNPRRKKAVNGKRIEITDDDLLAMAQFANMRERKARAVLDEIKDVIRAWPRFAAEAEVSDEFVSHISNLLDGRLPT